MVEQSLLHERVSNTYSQGRTLKPKALLKLPIPFHWFGTVLALVDALMILAVRFGAAKVHSLWAPKGLPGGSVLTITSLVAALLFFLMMQTRRLYDPSSILRRRRPAIVLRVWCIVVVAIATLSFFAGLPSDHSRGATICFLVAGGVVLPALSYAAERMSSLLIENDLLKPRRRVAVFGELTGMHAASVLSRLEKYGFDVVGRIDTTPCASGWTSTDIVRLFGLARNQSVDEILLIFKGASRGTVRNIAQTLQELPIPVRLLLDDHIDWLFSMPACDLGAVRAIELQGGTMSLQARFVKRSFDLLVASFGLLLLSPLLLLVALAVWSESRGPVIFRQRRAGFNGRKFNIYKFRSMTSLDDGATIQQATRNDSRVTRVGRFIRRTSIDELPQLLNVIRGEMSIVGPRPHALAHDDQYMQAIKSYARRHHMKPGITGWAQVNGCRGETSHLAAMEMRIRYDIWYIKHWSLLLDGLAVAKTVRQAMFPKNVY